MLTTKRIHTSSLIEEFSESIPSHTSELIDIIQKEGYFHYRSRGYKIILLKHLYISLVGLYLSLFSFLVRTTFIISIPFLIFCAYFIYSAFRYRGRVEKDNLARKNFVESLHKLNEIRKGEVYITNDIKRFNSLIQLDKKQEGIDPIEIEKIKEQIESLQYSINTLWESYKNTEKYLMLNKWVFWDKNEILALFEEYKVKNQKHIYSLNTRVKKLIESWIKIHTEELKELDNQLRSETRTIKDKSGKLALEQQIMRLEQYISSIQSIPKY